METERNPNLRLRESKAASRAIVTKREIARSRAAATNRAADANKAEANQEAVSKADDKALRRELTSGGRRLPPLFLARLRPRKFGGFLPPSLFAR
jgi:hypothetical protein